MMMIKTVRSLSAKLLLIAGGITFVILAVAIGLTSWQTKVETERLTFEQALAQSDAVSGSISSKLGVAISAAKAMAGAIEAAHDAGMQDRQTVVQMLEANMHKYDILFGSWLGERPGAFGGNGKVAPSDAASINKDGIFSPYWVRNADGSIKLQNFAVDYKADWYDIPATSRKGYITEPFIAPTTKQLLNAIAFPVIVKGQEIAVAGGEITLATLSSELEQLKPFGNGKVYLVSGQMNWVVAPEVDLRTKPFDGAGKAEIEAALKDMQPKLIRDVEGPGGVRVERFVHPFKLPELDTTWATVIDVPVQTIAGPIQTEMRNKIIGGVIALLIILAALYLATIQLVRKPMASLLDSVAVLSNRDYETPVKGQNRNDEVGSVAKALEGFRHALAEGLRSERSAKEAQSQIEQHRVQQAEDQQAKAQVLQAFVDEIERGFTCLSEGDLTVRLQRAAAPEYQKICDKFNDSIEKLEGTLSAVIHSIGLTRSGLGEINSATNDLARRTEQQAAGLEETTAALAEVSKAANETAESAGRAQQSAAEARKNAEKGGDIVRQAVQAMTEIERSSEEIGKIIGVINEIAFQTNLLALNAGVEAARAGEAGKGFAVVAQEVRALAQRSAEAANGIKELISRSTEQVGQGVQLVTASGRSLEDIVMQFETMSQEVSEIARTAREQSGSLREVSAAANQMDTVTQQNAAMVEETTAAAQQLSSETEALAEMIARFRTNKIVDHGARRRASSWAA